MKETDIRNPEFLKEYVKLSALDVDELFDDSEYVRVACPACNSIKYVREFSKGGFDYVSCLNCDTIYVNPRPTQKQLDEFYSKSKSATFFAKNFIGPYAEKRREKIFVPRVRDIIGGFPELSKKRIGDIGSGNGIFLEELKKYWQDADLVAIEPSSEAGKICRLKGLVVIPKMIEDVDESEGGFSLLCSFELFEHLYNPSLFLSKIHSLLVEGGIIYLTTLNGRGFDIQMLWDKHDNVCPPHHLNFCNPKSMKILFERCGFEILSIETPGRLDWDIVEQRARNGELELGRFWSGIVESDEKTKQEFQKWLQNNRLSSHIRVIAKKK